MFNFLAYLLMEDQKEETFNFPDEEVLQVEECIFIWLQTKKDLEYTSY